MTVFLTTQYLEEADIMADRVGIIDHGEIVAEDSPAALKAEIGRPTVEVVPLNAGDWAAISELFKRFGELVNAVHSGVAVRLRPGVDDIADVIRALDADGLRVSNVQLHAPTLDDVFLAKTGRSLEGAAEEADDRRTRRARPDQRRRPTGRDQPARRHMNTPSLRLQFAKLARRSIARTLRQPPVILPNLLFPLFMLAVVVEWVASDVTNIKGFPTDSYLTFVLGGDAGPGRLGGRDHGRDRLGNDIGTGFLSRLALTPMRASTVILANLAGVAVLGVDPGRALSARGARRRARA